MIPTPRLGIRMDGTQARFLDLILTQAKVTSPSFSLFELGTAEGFTLGGITEWLVAHGVASQSTLVSCDLPNGWSRDDIKLYSNMTRTGLPWSEHRDSGAPPLVGRVQVYYVDGRQLIGDLYAKHGFSPSFTFIDGCHGKSCLVSDFLAIEPTTKPGALVSMHDAGVAEQGSDYQDHCKERINVRQGLVELGLMTNARAGWTLVEEIPGDRARGGDGNSIVVVRRIG